MAARRFEDDENGTYVGDRAGSDGCNSLGG
jgi:hypothetical protein